MWLEQVSLLFHISFLLGSSDASTGFNTNYSVVQFPSEVVAVVGDMVTLKCAFSIQIGKPNPTKGAMSWFKGPSGTQSEVVPGDRFSLSYPDTFLSSGEGQLIITNVSLEDAGCYTCQVMLWTEGEARGNGIKLHVYARPSHPAIILQLQREPVSTWTLVCKTEGFYPAPVQLTWYHSGLKLPASQWDYKDPTGFFQASSFLNLTHPNQRASYICSIEHLSLTKPLRVQYDYEPYHQGHLSPVVVGILNLLKIGVISAITILTPVCICCCKKLSRSHLVGRTSEPQHWILRCETGY